MSDSQNVGFGFTVSTGADASIFGVNQLPDVLGIVKAKLQQAATNDGLFAQVFGDKANTAEFQAIRHSWAIGDFSQLPSVQILSADITKGAFGLYAHDTKTVYLADTLFQSNAAPTNSLFGAVGVLVEETFHWLDDRVGADTQGDEGELGRNLLFNSNLSSGELTRIKSEDDSGIIVLNGQSLAVEKNDTLAIAENLGILNSVCIAKSGWVGTYYGKWVPNDYYRFQLTNPAMIDLKLMNLENDVDLYLLDSSGGTIIQSSENSGRSEDSISRQLGVGTYYIQVKQYRQNSGDSRYDLAINSILDYAGNDRSSARNIGTLITSDTSYIDSVGSVDKEDYYSFYLNGTRNLRLSLTGLSADADVQVLNSAGAVVGESKRSGNSSESINLDNLGGGTYYARVYRYSGDTNYTVRLRGEIPEPPWNVMSGLAKDIDIGNDGSMWVIGANPVPGGYGIYRWTEAGWQGVPGGAVKIAVQSDGVPWVVNDSGNIFRWDGSTWQGISGLAKDIDVGSDGSVWVIGANPVGGGYGIYKWNGTGWNGIDGGAVRIAVDASGNPWVVNSYGNIFRRVNNVWQGLSGLAKDISVGSDGSVWVIGMNPVAGGYGIYKWNGTDWNGVAGGATGIAVASNGRSLVVNSYGNIFFQSGASIVASQADFAGNSLQTAKNINLPIQSFGSAISGSIIESDWVGTYDTNDYYRFSLNTRSQFDLKLNGLSADADVQLLNANGAVIATSNKGSTSSESIIRDLDAGIYFIRVFSFNNNNTKYDLLTSAKSLASIPISNWKAEFFNNFDRVGTPVLVQDWGSGSQNFKYDWGSGSPMAGLVNSDNFSARVTTQRYFAAGTYQIQTTSDDGVRVRIDNQTIIDKWIDQGSTNHYGFFTTTGGYFNVSVEYYERGGAANLNFFAYTPVGGAIGDLYKSLGGANGRLGLSTSGETYENDQITIRRRFQNGEIVNNRLTGETEDIYNGDSPSWLRYEKLAKETIYYSNQPEHQPFNYRLERVIDLSSQNGFYAFGLVSKDANDGRPPVIVFRGSGDVWDFLDDLNPLGIGRTQFDNAKTAIRDLLDRLSSLSGGKKADVIGHSLGGGLAQLTAGEFTDKVGKIVTFNSSGINEQNVKDFDARGGRNLKVIHYITEGDPVSYGGQKFINGIMINVKGAGGFSVETASKSAVIFAYLGVLAPSAASALGVGQAILDNHLKQYVNSDKQKTVISVDSFNNNPIRKIVDAARTAIGAKLLATPVGAYYLSDWILKGASWAIGSLKTILSSVGFQ